MKKAILIFMVLITAVTFSQVNDFGVEKPKLKLQVKTVTPIDTLKVVKKVTERETKILPFKIKNGFVSREFKNQPMDTVGISQKFKNLKKSIDYDREYEHIIHM